MSLVNVSRETSFDSSKMRATGGEEEPQRGERSPGDASAGGLSLFCELTLAASPPACLSVGTLPAKDEHTSP